MYGRPARKYIRYNQREEIAKMIVRSPEKSYIEIADEFGVSEATVGRIAIEYGVQRVSRPY